MKHFGNSLHCIQDSFSGAHTSREQDGDAWRITKIMRYRDDSGKLTGEHKDEFDDVEGQGREGSDLARQATIDYLDNVRKIVFNKESIDWTDFFNKWYLPPKYNSN